MPEIRKTGEKRCIRINGTAMKVFRSLDVAIKHVRLAEKYRSRSETLARENRTISKDKEDFSRPAPKKNRKKWKITCIIRSSDWTLGLAERRSPLKFRTREKNAKANMKRSDYISCASQDKKWTHRGFNLILYISWDYCSFVSGTQHMCAIRKRTNESTNARASLCVVLDS